VTSTPAINKYLSRYAEPECQQLDGFPAAFLQGLVIPIYREDVAVVDRFREFAGTYPRTLLIVVINQPENDLYKVWYQAIFDKLSLEAPVTNNPQPVSIYWRSESKQLTLYSVANESSLLVIDRCTAGRRIPEKQGVGLARKIGNDVLCTLIHKKQVLSPWMSNTDADVELPPGYFEATQSAPDSTAALIYPFQHTFVDHTPHLPTLLYEFSLHYYVAGLNWAGSANAYHTIGSLISVNYRHYCQVRGFPKRSAAEDFYLLNKLVKTGKVISLKKPIIDIHARESNRVPFGTGPAVIKINAQDDPYAMRIYHPDSFVYLYYFLKLLAALAEQPSTIQDCCTALAIEPQHGIDRQLLLTFSSAVQLDQVVRHANEHGNNSTTRLKHLNGWFDGFKTLKLIHFCRDKELGTISFRDWSDKYQESYAFFVTDEMEKTLNKIVLL